MDEKLYKAVRVEDDGKLFSCLKLTPFLRVEYKVGEWTYPNPDVLKVCKEYGLFVSRTAGVLNDITTGVLYSNGIYENRYDSSVFRVYECEVVKPNETLSPHLGFYFEGREPRLRRDNYMSITRCPDTLIVSAVRLIKPLTYDELKYYY